MKRKILNPHKQLQYVCLFFVCTFLGLVPSTKLWSQGFTCPDKYGGVSQANKTTFPWNGITASTVTVTIADERNSSGQQNIVMYDRPAGAGYTGSTTTSFSYPAGRAWLKNGGYICPSYPTCPGTPGVNNYVGRIILDFSPAIPANEIFLEIYDADRRGVTSTVPDGSITFQGGATPADFEQLTKPAPAVPAVYNADGTISWGIPAAETAADKYVALIGSSTALVSRVVMFVRNITDDIGFRFLSVNPYSCIDVSPDINVTWAGKLVSGSIAHNDELPSTPTYGTPVAGAGNPSTSMPTINADGTYNFTSTVAGVYTFQVSVCASGQTSGCLTETLTITVQDQAATNNPPIANEDKASTQTGLSVTIPTLSNDAQGVNASPLSPSSVTLPGGVTTANGGSLSVNATTGDITYTPATGFTGIDTYQYSVCNESGQCVTSIQTIKVAATGINTTSANDDYVQTLGNALGQPVEPIIGNVLNNDVDAEDQVQTIDFITTTSPGGALTFNSTTGEYTFTPTSGFEGTVYFPYTVTDASGETADATLYITVYPSTTEALPVTFGKINGELKGGIFRLSWQTLTESNNDHFEIEASADGKNFTKIGTVASKTIDGNSDTLLNYEFSMDTNSASLLFGAGGLMLLVCSFFARRRNMKLLSFAAFIAISTVAFSSCNKKETPLDLGNNKEVYIRIAQVDKDGTKKYSKTIKVVAE